jgi:hypothetical protein
MYLVVERFQIELAGDCIITAVSEADTQSLILSNRNSNP